MHSYVFGQKEQEKKMRGPSKNSTKFNMPKGEPINLESSTFVSYEIVLWNLPIITCDQRHPIHMRPQPPHFVVRVGIYLKKKYQSPFFYSIKRENINLLSIALHFFLSSLNMHTKIMIWVSYNNLIFTNFESQLVK